MSTSDPDADSRLSAEYTFKQEQVGAVFIEVVQGYHAAGVKLDSGTVRHWRPT